MMKFLRFLLLTVLAFAAFTMAVYADEERPLFDDSTVIVIVNNGAARLMSTRASGDAFSDFGINGIKSLGRVDSGEYSLFRAAGSGDEILELTLSESGEENVLAAVDALNGSGFVKSAQPNYYYYLTDIPDDYSTSKQYSLDKVGAEEVWAKDIDCSGVTVAILDSGAAWAHEDLADNIWINEAEYNGKAGVDDDGNGYTDDIRGWDFINNDNNPMDDIGHGTHVAGIISAVSDNGKGVASLARNAKIMPLKIFNSSGSSSSSAIVSAIAYLKNNGADIANCSWATTTGVNDTAMEAAIRGCSKVAFVAAAGNWRSGVAYPQNINSFPMYPASYDYTNVISVGATDSSDNIASYSCYGSSVVQIAAPGSTIYSTGWRSANAVNYYKYDSGTSMATPLVSSAAAVVKAAFPKLTARQVIDKLTSTADTLSSLEGYIIGARRLNAANAVADYAAPTPTPTPSPTPMPTPTPIPTLEPISGEASLTMENGKFLLTVTTEASVPLTVYAAYRDGDVLKQVEKIELTSDLTAEFTPSGGNEDYALTVYIWDENMRPLCPSVVCIAPSENITENN